VSERDAKSRQLEILRQTDLRGLFEPNQVSVVLSCSPATRVKASAPTIRLLSNSTMGWKTVVNAPLLRSFSMSRRLSWLRCASPWLSYGAGGGLEATYLVPRSRTNTSSVLLVSAAIRFDALEVNETFRPWAEIAGSSLAPLPSVPAVATDTRLVTLSTHSRTNTSGLPLVSVATRLVAREVNATYRLSAEIAGLELYQSASAPERPTDTRIVSPASRSRTKTSDVRFVSPTTRFEASEPNAT